MEIPTTDAVSRLAAPNLVPTSAPIISANLPTPAAPQATAPETLTPIRRRDINASAPIASMASVEQSRFALGAELNRGENLSANLRVNNASLAAPTLLPIFTETTMRASLATDEIYPTAEAPNGAALTMAPRGPGVGNGDGTVPADLGVNLARVNFSLGIAGVNSEAAAITQFLRRYQIAPAKVILDERELNGCALVVIAERGEFSSREIAQLQRYLQRGGKLWLHNCGGFPLALTDGFDAEFLSAPQNQKIAGDASAGLLALIRDGEIFALASDGETALPLLPAIMNYFAQVDLFAAPTAVPASTPTNRALTIWQNFSGVAADQLNWAPEKWSNPARVTLAPDGAGGEALLVTLNGGATTRAAISYTVPDSSGRRLDLRNYAAHQFDVYNAGAAAIPFSLGLTCQTADGGWEEWESAPLMIQPGWNREVKITLAAMTARRISGAGASTPNETSRRNCAKITYHLRTSAAGELLFDNLGWE
jgi:hypothetical protein